MSSIAELEAIYGGTVVLVVGGTRGIGLAITDTLLAAGATVIVVGRSAKYVSPTLGVAADLSTVVGCMQAVTDIEVALASSGATHFSFVVFTVGVWPDTGPAWATADGVDKVLALDLVARHILLTQLASQKLLGDGCRVMSVLATSQRLPSALISALPVALHAPLLQQSTRRPLPCVQTARAFVRASRRPSTTRARLRRLARSWPPPSPCSSRRWHTTRGCSMWPRLCLGSASSAPSRGSSSRISR